MGLLDTIRSLLGLSGGSDDRREGDGELTVEHDPSAPSNDPPPEPEPEPEPEPAAPDDSPAAAGTDATASTGSMVDESVAGPNEAAEPPEATTATSPQVDPEAGGAAESDAGVESLVDEAEDDGDEAEADQHDPVETVRGIGPAYADRLGDAGVETVPDLAAADPTALAAAIEVAESRVERWVDRARDRTA